MKISSYYPSGVTVLADRYCDCDTHYGPDGIWGDTKMQYLGEGRWICPKCGRVQDCHEVVFRARLEFAIDGDSEDRDIMVSIIEPILDKRLLQGKPRNLLSILEETFAETYDEFEDHELGVYECEIMYYTWEVSTDEGEDGDEEFEIISEKRLAGRVS